MYFASPSTAGWSDESSPSLAFVLTIVQSAAILEIVHAALGLVRSPVFVTTMQVGSRIVALHMLNVSPKAQSKSLTCPTLHVALRRFSHIEHMMCVLIISFVLCFFLHNLHLMTQQHLVVCNY